MKKPTVREQVSPVYMSTTDKENAIIAQALAIIDKRFKRKTFVLGNPRESSDYLKLKLGGRVAEAFNVLWLDTRHRVIALDELFTGTIDGATIHSREVVRAALHHNAAACILAHNHPSGIADPSAGDRAVTRELIDALRLVGVRVLDHIIVGEGEPVSMAQRGLI